MSRFYDALREADRYRQGVRGIQELSWEQHDVPVANDASPPGVDASLALSSDDIRPSPEPEAPESTGIALVQSPITRTFNRKALIRNAVDPLVVEQYRRLRTKIIQYHSKEAFRSLLVTSPSPEEGKTVTVLNLALSFAMLPSFKVLVVDGDLRRGSLGKWLGVGERPGLSNLIDGSATLAEVVLKSDAIPIHLIGCGTSKTPAGELLQSGELSRQFQKMTEQFALVLVDSPPVNLITDAQLLAGSCDGVILVTRAFSTTRKSLERAIQDLQPFRVIGTILNGGTRSQLYGRYKGYY
jgi:capsular exopolysaccharide synthesis family protein